MEALVMTAQLLLGLSILVGLHELGHLVAAKAFGMKVEKYSIGFPPKIFGIKIGETEYSLGAIPLGGFVKIAGMVDESLDTQQLASAPEPWEFRAKPAWQRLIVMLGGIIVNVITGIVIFILLVYINGETYYTIDEVNKLGVHTNELGREMGFREGDKIVSINGSPINRFEDVKNPKVLLQSGSYFTVQRDNQQLNIRISEQMMDKMADDKESVNFISPRMPFKVKEVTASGPAGKAGIKTGDLIVQVGDSAIQYFHQLPEALKSYKSKAVPVTIIRDGQTQTLQVQLTEEGMLQIKPEFLLKPAIQEYSFFEAIPKGTSNAFDVIALQLAAFGKIFRGEASLFKSLSGPVGIAEAYGSVWDWLRFWTLTAMLSMVLAFMNFLPIPALDGGHVMFLSFEIVSGRAPSEKFLEAAQKVGMVILISLMVLAFGSDIYKRIKDKISATPPKIELLG